MVCRMIWRESDEASMAEERGAWANGGAEDMISRGALGELHRREAVSGCFGAGGGPEEGGHVFIQLGNCL